jgi:hypothetical protein
VVVARWLKSFKGLAEEDIDDNDNRISRESVAALQGEDGGFLVDLPFLYCY